MVSTVPKWTVNFIWNILIEIIFIIPKMVYTRIIYSVLKPYIDIFQDWCCFHTQITDLDLPFDIFYVCMSVISIIFNIKNCWIDSNIFGFDTIYQLFLFQLLQIIFFFLSTDFGFCLTLYIVAGRCMKILMWYW